MGFFDSLFGNSESKYVKADRLADEGANFFAKAQELSLSGLPINDQHMQDTLAYGFKKYIEAVKIAKFNPEWSRYKGITSAILHGLIMGDIGITEETKRRHGLNKMLKEINKF